MSLILAARFKEGIVVASDSFVFDNDGLLPTKRITFQKHIISTNYGLVIAGVGSRWLLNQVKNWLDSVNLERSQLLGELAKKWSSLNAEWKSKRTEELEADDSKPLRTLSDSLALLVDSSCPSSILILLPTCEVQQSNTFVLAGSGNDLVRHQLHREKIEYNPQQTLHDCLSFAKWCFDIASNDLYVTGFPTFTIVTQDHIEDVSEECLDIYRRLHKNYFEHVFQIIEQE